MIGGLGYANKSDPLVKKAAAVLIDHAELVSCRFIYVEVTSF